MTMKEVIETELKCVQRDCCRLENECAKCDLVLPKEEIINAYNEALKLEEENAELKAGMETKWHDLKKDPSDLPEPYATVLDEDGNKITYQGGSEWTFYSDYYEMDIEAIKPVAWCEIPTFKV